MKNFYQILVWHHTMTSFTSLNLFGEATHPHTNFTLISVGSYDTLDLYNTPLLGNSGLYTKYNCTGAP